MFTPVHVDNQGGGRGRGVHPEYPGVGARLTLLATRDSQCTEFFRVFYLFCSCNLRCITVCTWHRILRILHAVSCIKQSTFECVVSCCVFVLDTCKAPHHLVEAVLFLLLIRACRYVFVTAVVSYSPPFALDVIVKCPIVPHVLIASCKGSSSCCRWPCVSERFLRSKAKRRKDSSPAETCTLPSTSLSTCLPVSWEYHTKSVVFSVCACAHLTEQ